MLGMRSITRVLTRLSPFLHPWGSGSIPSTHSELLLALSPRGTASPFMLLSVFFPMGSFWEIKDRKGENEVKIPEAPV